MSFHASSTRIDRRGARGRLLRACREFAVDAVGLGATDHRSGVVGSEHEAPRARRLVRRTAASLRDRHGEHLPGDGPAGTVDLVPRK